MISLSLLLTSHLRIFQHPRVRSSTACYCSFNLLISRSPPLRVYCQQLHCRTIRTRFPFASAQQTELRLATDNNSQTHYAKGKRSPNPFELRFKWEVRIAKFEVRTFRPKRRVLIRPSHFVFRTSIWLKAKWVRLPHIVCNRFQVLFHSLNKGSFHRSLAVLVHYRLPTSI